MLLPYVLFVFLYVGIDPGMSLNCARPGYVVKVSPDPGMS